MNIVLAFPLAAVIVAFAALAVFALASLRGKCRVPWRELAVSEDGAAYSLSYVMATPALLLLVCLIIQASIAMVVKLGTTYAAFAAARSYAVWLPSNPSLADEKAQQGAAQVMAAFGGGKGSSGGGNFASAYQQYNQNEAVHVSSVFVGRNLGYARSATQVSLDSRPSSWVGDVKATVAYQMHIAIPAVGIFMGARRSGGGYVLPIESKATVQVEGVKDKPVGADVNPLGIRYDPGEL